MECRLAASEESVEAPHIVRFASSPSVSAALRSRWRHWSFLVVLAGHGSVRQAVRGGVRSVLRCPSFHVVLATAAYAILAALSLVSPT